ncbi:hypothetical protein BELL_0194g00010 [Botrytis elliptica]|uniref:Uncharacterized protein n=1 Tax=Botrytis elliptica TaxID=278938 RepID=A0A4Z1JPQ5_9HELO|nr:hypothetical protein BELL_0194g00010 [Botrytis elliptica]
MFRFGSTYVPLLDFTTSFPYDAYGDLISHADHVVHCRFPQLTYPPPHQKRLSTPTTTAKLYNGIAPLDPNHAGSIDFLGQINICNSLRAAEAQAIWSTAYPCGHLALSTLAEMQQRVAYTNGFSRRRYPSHGQKGGCISID